MKNHGFSLVELIVVIAIMAVLAGVAVPVYSSFVEEAKKKTDNDYVAQVYRLACVEAQKQGLMVEKVAVALEDDDDDTNVDFTGRLAEVTFVGQDENNADDFKDAEIEVIKAVWEMMEPHVFEHKVYLSWVSDDGVVKGVEYTRENDSVSGYPYTIQGYEDQDKNNDLKLPSISI